MKVFGANTKFGEAAEVVSEFDLPAPEMRDDDLVVVPKAFGVNPVDVKVLGNWGQGGDAKDTVVGWDVCGVVEKVGPKVTKFNVGDEVVFAGDITRGGMWRERAYVSETIAAKKPSSLSAVEASSFPLTALTAYEILFEEMAIKEEDKENNSKKTLLVYPGAGGVGSMAIQMAKHVLGLTVIATASREDTITWCKELGADHVINHRNNLKEELSAIGVSKVNYILSAYNFDKCWPQYKEVIAPFGKVVDIIGAQQPVDLSGLLMLRVSITFEIMYARSMYGVDPQKQGDALTKVGEWLDGKIIRHAHKKTFKYDIGGIKEALAYVASGKSLGKTVLEV